MEKLWRYRMRGRVQRKLIGNEYPWIHDEDIIVSDDGERATTR